MKCASSLKHFVLKYVVLHMFMYYIYRTKNNSLIFKPGLLDTGEHLIQPKSL